MPIAGPFTLHVALVVLESHTLGMLAVLVAGPCVLDVASVVLVSHILRLLAVLVAGPYALDVDLMVLGPHMSGLLVRLIASVFAVHVALSLSLPSYAGIIAATIHVGVCFVRYWLVWYSEGLMTQRVVMPLLVLADPSVSQPFCRIDGRACLAGY